jgi:hypothetical protein
MLRVQVAIGTLTDMDFVGEGGAMVIVDMHQCYWYTYFSWRVSVIEVKADDSDHLRGVHYSLMTDGVTGLNGGGRHVCWFSLSGTGSETRGGEKLFEFLNIE